MSGILSADALERIIGSAPRASVGVLGDMFLDRYLEIERSLDEPSVETGLTAYQVARVRSHPGAAGTVVANLASLGVGRIIPFAFAGDDGEGYELRTALKATPGVDLSGLVPCPERRTPTYTKPMHHHSCQPAVEGHRLDIKNRRPTPPDVIEAISGRVSAALDELDALLVLDQVSEADCGVVTATMRRNIAAWSQAKPGLFMLGDSRELLHLLSGVALKPNWAECRAALQKLGIPAPNEPDAVAGELARAMGKPVYLTVGKDGMIVAWPDGALERVPAFPVSGPTDPVGAGDSTSAGLLLAMAAGAKPLEAAAFGCLVASITVAQIGVTGTASPAELREALRRHAGSSA